MRLLSTPMVRFGKIPVLDMKSGQTYRVDDTGERFQVINPPRPFMDSKTPLATRVSQPHDNPNVPAGTFTACFETEDALAVNPDGSTDRLCFPILLPVFGGEVEVTPVDNPFINNYSI